MSCIFLVQASMATLQTVRAILNVLDLEPRTSSHFVGEGLLQGLFLRMQRVSDMDVVEQCVKW